MKPGYLILGCLVFLILGPNSDKDAAPAPTSDTLALDGSPRSIKDLALLLGVEVDRKRRAAIQQAIEYNVFNRYRVVRVIDGDTLVVERTGIPITVRLLGVDTPETVKPATSVEPYGPEATTFLRNLLLGEGVCLTHETGILGRQARDRYGRVLAYIYRVPDGLFVNLEIVRQGYGRVYTKYPFRHQKLFTGYGESAQRAKRGLWADGVSSSTDNGIAPAPAITSPRPTQLPARTPKATPTTVYGTRTGSKYHRSGCRYLRKSKIPMPLEEAKRRYGPCSVCKPPR